MPRLSKEAFQLGLVALCLLSSLGLALKNEKSVPSYENLAYLVVGGILGAQVPNTIKKD